MAGPRGGYLRVHRNGILYWSPRRGAFWVHDAILGKDLELGGPGLLGYPTTDETGCPDNVGRYNDFERGSIYWPPETGAHEVHGWASASSRKSSFHKPSARRFFWTRRSLCLTSCSFSTSNGTLL